MLVIIVPGLPVTKGSHRAMIHPHTGRAMLLPAADKVRRGRLASWEATVRLAAQAAVAALVSAARASWPLAGAVELRATFYLPRPKRPRHPLPISKPDADKLERSMWDGLTGVVFLDDAQVTTHRCRKRYADVQHPVGVEIIVEADAGP